MNDIPRDDQILQVVESVARRREAGESISDEEVISAHPSLMPELGERLRVLHVLESVERGLAEPTCSIVADSSPDTLKEDPCARMPRRIGHYTLKRVIASGGMGTVYEAVQEKPRRTVAVKVMRQGIASRSALRRFEYEAQLLARLRHSGIAQVYEAGTHRDETGTVPYFVMEYIPNAKSITEFARDRKLGTRDRLKLFAQVCDAVHHGHQKGIIHRDLKPGNILVDSQGQAKIIDFGVARSTDSDMAVTTLQTDVGQLIGTLQYMSPEQCEADPHDIDIRSDIYALGVVFYELLCDELPYDVIHKTIPVATRVIREQVPRRLSTLNKTLRGDVETIAMKALEKERERRYQSAADFGQDLLRYLNNEPITARRATMSYHLRILARRHKAFFGAVAAVFVILVGATIVSSLLYVNAERAKREVELAHATSNNNLGMIHESQGEFVKAEPLLREVLATRKELLGERHPDIAASLNNLAMLLRKQGRLSEAEDLYREALAMNRNLSGNEHDAVAKSLNNLAVLFDAQGRYAEAEPLYQEALGIYRKVLGDNHFEVANALGNLATLALKQGDYAKAESLYDQALTSCPDLSRDGHPTLVNIMSNLGVLLLKRGELGESAALLRHAADKFRIRLGEDHWRVGNTLSHLGECLTKLEQFGEAEQELLEAYRILSRSLGDIHERTERATERLVTLYEAWGTAEPGKGYEERAAVWREKVGVASQSPAAAGP